MIHQAGVSKRRAFIYYLDRASLVEHLLRERDLFEGHLVPPPQALHGISIATISRMSINVVLISAQLLVGLVLLFPDHGSRVRAGIFSYSRLSDCSLTSFRQHVEVTTARVQHTCAGQFIDGVEHALPFGWFVACRLE